MNLFKPKSPAPPARSIIQERPPEPVMPDPEVKATGSNRERARRYGNRGRTSTIFTLGGGGGETLGS